MLSKNSKPGITKQHERLDKQRVVDNGPVHLSYELYRFSEGTVFFSRNESANRTFSHGFFSETNGANIYDSELNIMQGHDRHVSTLFSA